MAEVDFDRFDPAAGGQPSVRRGMSPANLVGAAASVVLAVGLGVWGYQIAVRDALGIPVVRAPEGPMRLAPPNPGGRVADHQGLSVNNVPAVGVAAPVPDQLTLAPRPVDLTPQDVAGLGQAEEPAVQPVPGLLTAPPVEVQPTLVSATSAGPVVDVTPQETMAPAVIVPGGIGKTMRPQARPSGLAPPPAATEAALETTLASVAQEVDPASIAPGTWLVQLGAFDATDQARSAWDKLAGPFSELMSGKERVIQTATSGGRSFFRLRAKGFADRSEAQRFCAALVAEGATCIPVAQR